MATTVGGAASGDGALLELFRAIARGDHVEAARRLGSSAGLATDAIRIGATRNGSAEYFLSAIRHYVYRGDTALHVAAAANQPALAASLVTYGARTRARNRRGAEPLHYAADGSPGAEFWDPVAQGAVIGHLIGAGADPDARDNSGVAPLHRAVRTRSSEAVRTLIEHGADPLLKTKSGSTPLHLAVQDTGRSNSGSAAARDQQRRVIVLLLQHGARPTDVDANGKTVAAAASGAWIRDLLDST